MRPRSIGRALGVGVRVAGRMAGQRLAGQPQASAAVAQAQHTPSGTTAGPAVEHVVVRTPGQVAAQAGRSVRRGAAGFLRPFRRVGGMVWLEVTGTFFLLFAGVFALRLWQNWAGMGAASREIVIATAAVFLYLGVSSFWRSRRR